MKRIAMTVMLKDSPGIIDEYERIHADPWPVVLDKGREAGIKRILIYRYGRQLFMLLEADDDFDIETGMDEALACPEMIKWDKLTRDMQEALPGEPEGTRWVQMKEVHAVENGKLIL